MKKVLLLAAVAFGLNGFAQDAIATKLLQTEITPDAAAKEKIAQEIAAAADARKDDDDKSYRKVF